MDEIFQSGRGKGEAGSLNQGRRRTNLVLDKPASQVLPGALLLALEPTDEHRLVARGLHVEGPVHVGGAVVPLEPCSRGGSCS